MNETSPITDNMEWRELLANPGEREHSVQLYSDVTFLTTAVSHFVGAALNRGEAAIVVAIPDHHDAIKRRLTVEGYDVPRARDRGQLMVLDATETLSDLMVNGAPDAKRFMPFIGGLIDQASAQHPRVRVYGEMVNLLWQQGAMAAALELEELWNELGKSRPFALHCAYALDNFDRATHCCAFHGVQCAHSHLIPVEDYGRLDSAVNRAFSDVLGPTESQILKSVLLDRRPAGAQMPRAQSALQGLSALLPNAADAVLARARKYYHLADERS
ncbi:MAG: MEDS domain-containing protein [Actinomycetota bacterium]